jgi:hypothetical protein
VIYHLNTKGDLHTDEIKQLRNAHGAELKTVSDDAAAMLKRVKETVASRSGEAQDKRLVERFKKEHEKQKKNAERLLKVAENRSRTAADAVHARSMMLAERRARHMARFAGSPSLMLTNSPRSSRTRR